jgi:cation diffusion facilitator family transporter
MTDIAVNTHRVALRVSLAALLLAIAKAAVGVTAGSVALLSSALDSAGDAFASFANFLFLTVAAKPPDEDHQFGHGKAENLAMLLQGAVLMAGAIAVGVRAVERIRHPRPIDASMAAVVAMLGSIAVTFGITLYLKRNAAASGSAALAGDALHYTSDFVANGATLLALILVKLTANPLFDSILGVSVAGWIAWSSLYLIWNAGSDLMDPALPEEEIARIIEAIERADPAVVGYRELRTRRAAGVRFIDFELCIDRAVSFEHAHEVTENVKQRIREHFPRVVINAHAEPVDGATPP